MEKQKEVGKEVGKQGGEKRNRWKDERVEKRSRNREKRSRKPEEIGDNRVLFTLDKWMDRVKGGKWEYLMI